MPSITCPCCQSVTSRPDNIANGYCGRCHWWTSDQMMAPYHFALPCEHRGLGVIVPRLGAYFRETRLIVRPDEPWLYTQPGTLLELSGNMRPGRKPLPWWRRLPWRRHISRIRALLKRQG